ncbi:MAG: hypothetical protein ACI4IF_07800 [Acutalibacteraceae bacterium]
MKRVLSFILCAVMCLTTFVGTTAQVFAFDGTENEVFTVSDTGYKNDAITYTISLKAGVEKITGAVINVEFDSKNFQIVTADSGAFQLYDENVVSGIYEKGITYDNENVYAIAFMNPDGVSITADKRFMKVTVTAKGDERPETNIKITCTQLKTDDGDDTNDIIKGEEPLVLRDDTFQTLESVNLDEVASSVNCLKLSWKAIAGAHQYMIYRNADGGEWGEPIATIDAYTTVDGEKVPVTEYVDENIENGVEYGYSISCKGSGDYITPKNETPLVGMYFGTIDSISSEITEFGAKISWGELNGADSYAVFRRTAYSGWSKIADDLKDTTYEDNTLKGNTTYYYTVKAYKTSEHGEYVAGASCDDAQIYFVPVPEFESSTIYHNFMRISWEYLSYVDGYEVYRKAPGESEYTLVETTEANYYDDFDVVSGEVYSYKVKAVSEKTETVLSADRHLEVEKIPVTDQVTATLGYDSITVSWAQVKGVDGYKVYRKASGSSNWSLRAAILGAENTAYTETKNLSSGESYVYAVKSVKGDAETDYSDASNSVVYLDAPEVYDVRNVSGGIQFSFQRVQGAEEYIISRKENTSDAEFEKIATITDGTFIFLDETAESGVQYVYSVYAVCGEFQTPTCYSSVACRIGEPQNLKAENKYNGVNVSWDAVKGAEYYIVEYKAYGKDFAEYARVTQNECFVASPSDGRTSKYKITAVCGDIVGEPSEELAVYYMEAPELQLQSTASGVKITWEQTYSAEDYILYRKDGSSWKKIKTYNTDEADPETDTFTYIDTSAKTGGTTYTYTIKTYDGYDYSQYKTDGYSITQKNFYPVIKKLDNLNGSIKITWEPYPDAKSYIVYQKGTNGKWVQVGTSTGTSFTYNGKVNYAPIKSNTNCTYTVKALLNNGKYSSYDTKGTTIKYLSTPASIKVANNSSSTLTVSWGAVAGATGYNVYRANGSSWSKIGTTTKTSFTDSTAKSGTTYKYTVRAYSGSASSYYNTSGVAQKCLGRPAVKLANNTKNTVTVSWGKITGASKYVIYRHNGKKWVQIGTSTGTSFTDSTAKAGTTYKYTVKATSGSYSSTYGTFTITCIAMPKLKSVSANTSGVTVNWNKSTGAKGYIVYRKTAGGSWSKVGTVKSGSTVKFVDKTAKKGTKYYYTVKAYNGSYYSAYNNTGLSVTAK